MIIVGTLCIASLLAVWAIPAPNLASPTPTFLQQATPVKPTGDAQEQNAPAKPVKPPSSDSSGRYRVGNGVSAPILIYSVTPELPAKFLKKKRFTGIASCTVSVTVDTDGKSQDVQIIKSFPDASDKQLLDAAIELQNSCIKAMRQCRFKPATYQGQPVAVATSIETTFPMY